GRVRSFSFRAALSLPGKVDPGPESPGREAARETASKKAGRGRDVARARRARTAWSNSPSQLLSRQVVEGCRVSGRMLPVQSRRDEPGILHRVFDIKLTEFHR